MPEEDIPHVSEPPEATAAECQAALSVASAKVKAAKRALREPLNTGVACNCPAPCSPGHGQVAGR